MTQIDYSHLRGGPVSIQAPTGEDLTLKGGDAAAAEIVVGQAADAGIVLLPGTPTSGYEYVDVQAETPAAPLGGDSFGLRSLFTMRATTVPYHSAAGLHQLNIPASSSTNSAQFLAGTQSYVKHLGTGTLSETNGTRGIIQTQGTGNMSEANCFATELSQVTSTGHMVTARHYYASPFSNPAAATKPTTLVAFDAADQGADGVLATNTYAFRSAGDSKCLFSGPVTIGGALSMSQPYTNTDSTESTSSSTGSVKLSGGLGVTKNIWCGQTLNFPATGSTSAIGINFGTSGEAMFRFGAGNLKITCGAGLYIDADTQPVTTAQNDLGTSSKKWRNINASGTISTSTATFRTGPNYQSSETGANNAIACALTDVNGTAIPQAEGLRLTIKLAHTLQVGANTFSLNGGAAKSIKSHRNPANDIGTAYAVGGIVDLMFDGTQYLDMSQ